MYYVIDNNGNRTAGYADCNGGFPSIDAAVFFCGETDRVVDESGNIVWSWEIWKAAVQH